MKKLRNVIIILIVLLVLGGGGYFGYVNLYLPSQEKWDVKIIDSDNNIVDVVEVMNGSIIEHDKGELTISRDTEEFKISTLGYSDKELFEDFKVIERNAEEKAPGYKIEAIFKERKDFVLSVNTDSHSKIKENDKSYSKRDVPLVKDSKIIDSLPLVEIEPNYKGFWVVQGSNEEIDDELVASEDITIEFITFQDKNDNGIDDFTESFTVTFTTGVKQKVDDIVVNWEDTIKLPNLKDDSKVFYEWYSDKDYKTHFTETTKITQDTNLYAKVIDISIVMNESVEKPIVRKDIAIQVERIINLRNDEVDKNFNDEILKENEERKEQEQYEKENNILDTKREYTTEFANTAENKLYFVTFIDEKSEFIYGFVAPYGRTIKVFDSTNKMKKEYAIRQHTTITLDSRALLAYNETLKEYASEYYKINETVYVKISPIVEIVREETSQE